MPTACMKAYTMVGPQKPKPCAFSAFDIFRDASLSVGMSARLSGRGCSGRPSTKSHRKAEKPGPPSWIASQARALRIVASILGAVADDAGVLHQRSTSRGPNRAIASGSKPAKARRKPSRRRRMVNPGQAGLEPVENQLLVEGAVVVLGTPHSVSW